MEQAICLESVDWNSTLNCALIYECMSVPCIFIASPAYLFSETALPTLPEALTHLKLSLAMLCFGSQLCTY